MSESFIGPAVLTKGTGGLTIVDNSLNKDGTNVSVWIESSSGQSSLVVAKFEGPGAGDKAFIVWQTLTNFFKILGLDV